MAKKIIGNLKLRIPGGKASAGPPVGSTLGQHGLQAQDFISQYNERTSDLKGQGDVTVKMNIFDDRTFTFTTSGIPADDLIRKALGIKKGSGVPQKDKVGKLTQAQLTEIAEMKMSQTNANDIEAAKAQIAGSARSMGVEVEKQQMEDNLIGPSSPEEMRERALRGVEKDYDKFFEEQDKPPVEPPAKQTLSDIVADLDLLTDEPTD